ncbi:MAG: hypothetical protein QOH82_315 [Mycobacterium sp.]|jgi:hypothetical protein|nr:hypothetical protein [Mycobacterium sp.]
MPAVTTGPNPVAILELIPIIQPSKGSIMRLGLNYITPLLAAGAAAVALAAAPIAAAAPTAPGDTTQAQQSCSSLGGTQTECQTPGNVQLNDAPPQVDFFPYAGGAT